MEARRAHFSAPDFYNVETERMTLPTIARRLLAAQQHDAEREEVLSGMGEEYVMRRRRDGSLKARLWLWRQVLASLPATVGRVWFRGTTGFESEANRMNGKGLGLESWIQDMRFALRSLRSRPLYVVLSVLTLALGIGGATAVFGIARAVLLEPLPYRASDELVLFWNMFDWSEAEVNFLRPEWTGFAGVAAYRTEGVYLQQDGRPARQVPGIASSAELFDVLGVRPMLGSGFSPADDAPGAEPVAVLGYGLWQELGADRSIVGKSIDLDGGTRRVVGVMPEGFWFPDPSVRVWLSTPMRPNNRSGNYALVGRMEAGRTAESMREPLQRITTRMGEQFTYPPQWDKTKNAQLTPVKEFLHGPVRPALLATLGAMGVILLMACANVATLMLGQLRGRSSELAVRIALGAGSGRLTRQLLVESIVLGLIAGAVGAFAAAMGFRLLLAALPLGELASTVTFNWTLFLVAMLIAFVAALLIALVPVLSLLHGDLRDALSRARTSGIGAKGRMEEALVIGEVALAVLLAAGAGVLIRSVANLQAFDSGIQANGVAVLDISTSGGTPEQRAQQLTQLVESLTTLPEVDAAAAIQLLPLRASGWNFGLAIEGRPELEQTTTRFRLVTHDYFRAMGIPVLRGRVFDARDAANSEQVIVIDQSLAEKYFPNEDPIDRRIATQTGWARIIGVVGAVAYGGLNPDERVPGRYMLFEQEPIVPDDNSIVVLVKDGRSPAQVLPLLARRIQQTAPTVALREMTTMQHEVATAMGPTLRIMQLMTLLGGLALLLGAIGVYGVVSHFVNRRRRDYVIRLALGMKPIATIRQVLGRGTALVGIGCAIGILAALLLTRTLASLLYEVDATDPLALGLAIVTLIAAGCVAALIPGIRASRANPAQVLRESA